jgi:dTDP-4-dehydrorhamnose reductase
MHVRLCGIFTSMNHHAPSTATGYRIPKILLLGGSGQLGFELKRTLAPIGQVCAPTRAELDLSDLDCLIRYIRKQKPDAIVNAAAYTAVDRAESETSLADALNHLLPKQLAEEARRIQALLIHYSTDYVFDGTHTAPYTETHPTHPLNHYGATKRAGEIAIESINPRYIILRTSWVIGAYGHNFMRTILKLASSRNTLNVVGDQVGAPTSAPLIADTTAHILRLYMSTFGKYIRDAETDQSKNPGFPFGLYHLTAAGATDWHALATYIIQFAQDCGRHYMLKPDGIKRITTAEYPTPAGRPQNSLLNTTRLQNNFNLCLPDWQEGMNYLLMTGL